MTMPLLASLEGQSPPYGEVALAIAFVGFLLVIIEVTLVRRREALEHDLHIPLDDGTRVGESRTENSRQRRNGPAQRTFDNGAKGGAYDEHA